jgi:peptide/nickel transport system permease protein
MSLIAVFAGVLTDYHPHSQDLVHNLLRPGERGHLLGTDEFGRDLWSRIIYGTRVSLMVGSVSVSIGLLCGCFLGLISGYFGKRTDMFLGRGIDVMMAFPSLLLALLLVAALGPSLINATIAIGITQIPRFFRVVRASTLVVKERTFVLAAKAVGRSDFGIVVRHVLPNIVSPILVSASLAAGIAILMEAGLSFLGLGAQPPTPSWGSIVNGGREYLDIAPWIMGFSGLAIMITVLGANLLGDGLRDVLDPKL